MRGDVTAGFDSIGIFEYGGILPIQDALDFIGRPDVERPLTGRRLSRSNSAVRILGGGEAAARLLRLTERKIENVARVVGIEAVLFCLVLHSLTNWQILPAHTP